MQSKSRTTGTRHVPATRAVLRSFLLAPGPCKGKGAPELPPTRVHNVLAILGFRLQTGPKWTHLARKNVFLIGVALPWLTLLQAWGDMIHYWRWFLKGCQDGLQTRPYRGIVRSRFLWCLRWERRGVQDWVSSVGGSGVSSSGMVGVAVACMASASACCWRAIQFWIQRRYSSRAGGDT